MRSWWRPFLLAAALGLAGCASAGKSTTTPAPGRCSTDADCRAFSDYCDGCACRALEHGAADPTCKGTVVQCFVDPCMNRHAVCTAGACALAQ